MSRTGRKEARSEPENEARGNPVPLRLLRDWAYEDWLEAVWAASEEVAPARCPLRAWLTAYEAARLTEYGRNEGR